MRALVVAVALLTTLAGCADSPADDERTLTVHAAASLKGPFTTLAERFEREHPGGVRVSLSLAGSSDVVAQVLEGAPADVVATADTETMQRLVDDGLPVRPPVVIATNTLVLVTPPGLADGVRSLQDLQDPDVQVVLCARQVPCGAAAERVLSAAGVDPAVVSEELAVTDVLAKVVSGEADAGLVYVTDALAADGLVETFDLPEATDVVNEYPVAVLDDGAPAREFVDLVTGPEGRAVLREAGFGSADGRS